ncbi:hypothetical protein SeLEV6574_g04210 [Synchytrium endobioticum]|uniref:Transcription initiation factor TFIID subunit 9 n=1 Tax=Synchytrium endobioticum TaxID=286115 RepID=A0A507D0E6_9FUNG|nr:hypothetical protein SeLEV6574_g04210 [Synchytrium endobioticum]
MASAATATAAAPGMHLSAAACTLDDEDAAQDASQLPRDARLIALLLQSMGIDAHEPRVLPQLLEFMHRYVVDVLNDAVVVADHAGHPDMTVADLELAVLSRLEHSFALPPSHDALLDLAEAKNAIPLPAIPEKYGFRVPPEARTLTSPNFVVRPAHKTPLKRKVDDALMPQPYTQQPQMVAPQQYMAQMPQPTLYPPQQPMYVPQPAVTMTNATHGGAADDDDYDMDG